MHEEADKLVADMEALLAANDYAGIKTLIETNKIKCASVIPVTGPMCVSST